MAFPGLLFPLEAPGPRSVGTEWLRPTARGSGIISTDNNDETAANFYGLRDEAGIAKHELVAWNIVPWYVGTTAAIRGVTQTDVTEARPQLRRLLRLLTRLEVVVPMGTTAQVGWYRCLAADPLAVVTVPSKHPSPQVVNRDRVNRSMILAALRRVRALLDL